jgi:hypothetical protein
MYNFLFLPSHHTGVLATLPLDPHFHITDRGDAFLITASVRTTESLFRTSLSPFRRTDSVKGKQQWIKFIGSLSVPSNLRMLLGLVVWCGVVWCGGV